MKNFKTFVTLFILVCSCWNVSYAQKSQLKVYEYLSPQDGDDILVSENGQYKLWWNQNGTIHLFKKAASGGWESSPFYMDALGGKYLVVQDDGNLVAYQSVSYGSGGASFRDAKWASGTSGRGGKYTNLFLQNDGNLVLYTGSWTGGLGDPLWATGTCGGKGGGCGQPGPR